ncbi:MAG TPA: 50S ribosomal protein L15 [Clostridiales bacterium]|nr:50S ribosomal protein L15 [Clostridiales bacterium]
MNLSGLKPAEGSKKSRFRKGRGHGSGNGKTAGKGHKGQRARSGRPRVGFEGGQTPLFVRIPKRGFTNRNSKDIITINVDDLNKFENDSVVTIESLQEKGIINNPRDGVKILGNGELTKKLDVKVNAYSKSAIEKIQALGGNAEVI